MVALAHKLVMEQQRVVVHRKTCFAGAGSKTAAGKRR